MIKEKVLELANKIAKVKKGSKDEIKPEHPEYIVLEAGLTDESAEVALCLEFRNPLGAEDIAPRCGKSVEETQNILEYLAEYGAACMNQVDGVKKYWLELFVPGHFEMIVNNKENIKKYPQVGKAFNDYGFKKAPIAAGNVPVGLGPMRVIPIEASINRESKSASYEEISKYLNENTIFSVSDCSCRTSREAMGEGCGHLKEDMCIQMNSAAEYYIRTGRGREITREEAFAIIKKAEENGLMHQIPNVEGPGHTHAICNCCGCGCYALRNANHWKNPDFIRSNYISVVDQEKCVACGECVENCPTNALKLGNKLCTTTQQIEVKQELPYDTEWGPDKWNPDYRINKEVVVDSGSSPCKADCPAHIGIQGYLKLASQGKYTEALQLIKEENPFPAVCGRICPRDCESACTRGDIDDPIAIDEIKKFIAEQDLNEAVRYIPTKKHEYSKKIAVIGAGPAGLSCAYYLAVEGYKVTVFEKEKILGGMLAFGIPSFRLEKDVVNAEIDILKKLGVEFKTGVEIGKDLTLKDLRKEDYKAFYIAIGAQNGRKLGIEGEDAEGITTGVDFLRNVCLDKNEKLVGKTIVIGGGNVAIDVARTAIRAGSSEVNLYCLENEKEMPALPEEIEEALSEDIKINNSWGVKKILTKNNKVIGVEFMKCISVFNKDGQFSPVYDENSTTTVDCDNVLISVGQAMDWGNLISDSKIKLNPNQTIIADQVTFQTDEPDVFTGGDAFTGPQFAINAIAMGKEGAISIHRYVNPGQSLILGRLKRDYLSFDKQSLDLSGYDRIPRQQLKHVDGKESKNTFHDLRTTFTLEQVKTETERCLSCGATVVDEFMCVGCGQCTTKCKFDAISLKRKYDANTVEFENLRPTIIKYALKRKIRIVLKKPIKFFKSFF